MRIIAVVGDSESGKTLLVSRLIGELKRRGIRTCAVKHSPHELSLDTKGKDTWTYAEAGADGTALVSATEWAIMRKSPGRDLARLARLSFPEAEVVIIEGGKDERGLRKIEVLRAGISETARVPAGELLALVSDAPVVPISAAPVFRPDQTSEISDLILSQEEAAMSDVKLEVDGRKIPLNAFVREFIVRTVSGMIAALSGVDPDPRDIILTIRRDVPDPGKK